MEGNEGGLEEQSDEEKAHGHEGGQAVGAGQGRTGRGVPRLPCQAEDEGQAEKHDRGAQRPEEEVLDPRLGRAPLLLEDPGQDIRRDGEELERHVSRDEVGRRNRGHHPDHREERQVIDLARLVFLDIEEAEGQDDGQGARDEDGRLEEERERVRHEVATEKSVRRWRRQDKRQAGHPDPGQGDVSRSPPASFLDEEVDEHGGHGRGQEHDLGDEMPQVGAGGRHHRGAS